VPEFDDENIRELSSYSYRIIYRLQDDDALIVAVIHGKRILQ
jgi:plasmid stabilization system protein ParE